MLDFVVAIKLFFEIQVLFSRQILSFSCQTIFVDCYFFDFTMMTSPWFTSHTTNTNVFKSCAVPWEFPTFLPWYYRLSSKCFLLSTVCLLLKLTSMSCRWIIDTPLEVSVPSKRTPWPDAPPELPSNETTITIEENREKQQVMKTRPRRSRRSRSKRKRETRVADTQVSDRNSGEK